MYCSDQYNIVNNYTVAMWQTLYLVNVKMESAKLQVASAYGACCFSRCLALGIKNRSHHRKSTEDTSVYRQIYLCTGFCRKPIARVDTRIKPIVECEMSKA